jgi:hypothetical protein
MENMDKGFIVPKWVLIKVAFIQKAWMNLSFPQTDKPHYFPELEF